MSSIDPTEGLPVSEFHTALNPRPWQVSSLDEYRSIYNRSINSPETYWGETAREMLEWRVPFSRSLEGEFGNIRWFAGGGLNACENAVDRWARSHPDRKAIIYEGDEASQVRVLTYKELLEQVCRMANLLKSLGVKKGDRVTIYLPMVPEAAISMLACARIGAVHSVVFGGFSAANLRERIIDANSEIVVTMNVGYRGGKEVKLKEVVDDAISDKRCNFVKKVVVFEHSVRDPTCLSKSRADSLLDPIIVAPFETAAAISREVKANEALKNQRPYCPPEVMDAEDLLFILYTSGSTGKPKGIAHTTAGYLLYTALTHKIAFDYRPGDIFGCMADVGWITGHSYVVYGPLVNGATTFMFESLPTYPDAGRYWETVARHRITHFYTAPTAIRTLMRYGNDFVTKHDRSSLRVLGSVGEPINPEAWRWYFDIVGDKKAPIIDTYWQTETGGFVITPLPCFALKPGSATLPFFGVDVGIFDPHTGQELFGPKVKGALVIKKPWPGMLRTVYGDHSRMNDTYFSAYPGAYFTGDGAVRDGDGYYWITGRVDDVIKVSGHRIGSAEVEHALVQHVSVAEAAVVGFPHEIKGEGLFCFVSVKEGVAESAGLIAELKQTVRKMIGPVATPDVILITPSLPKTRSGKIMRRILRKIVNGDEPLGDVSTLADPAVVPILQAKCRALLFASK